MFRLLFVLSTIVAITYGLKLPFIQMLDGRIVGGVNAEITSYPHQVSLQVKATFTNSYSHSCGGSIYNKRVIITAAHCLSGRSSSNLRVVVGISSLKDVKAENLLTIEKIIVNSKYSSSTIDNDVGLIILAEPLELSERASPIALATENPEDGVNAIVTGWGTLKESGSISNNLQEVTVPIVDNDSCGKSYGAGAITDTMICAGFVEGGKDACQGDSGGPMIVNGELVGIVSWGKGCARPGYPGVYSSVATLRPWIVSTADPYN